MFNRILVPVDGSPFSEAVFPKLLQLGAPGKTTIEVISVPNPPPYSGMSDGGIDYAAWLEVENKYASQAVAHAASTLREMGFEVHTHVGNGDVSQAIVDRAASTGAELIAMSTHGRSGISRALLGSVADRVAHHARVPVFLVRPDTKG
jgi:nucleotide-binding universal stress UspA family protein